MIWCRTRPGIFWWAELHPIRSRENITNLDAHISPFCFHHYHNSFGTLAPSMDLASHQAIRSRWVSLHSVPEIVGLWRVEYTNCHRNILLTLLYWYSLSLQRQCTWLDNQKEIRFFPNTFLLRLPRRQGPNGKSYRCVRQWCNFHIPRDIVALVW